MIIMNFLYIRCAICYCRCSKICGRGFMIMKSFVTFNVVFVKSRGTTVLILKEKNSQVEIKEKKLNMINIKQERQSFVLSPLLV
jgi:hypothetical protein